MCIVYKTRKRPDHDVADELEDASMCGYEHVVYISCVHSAPVRRASAQAYKLQVYFARHDTSYI